MEQTSRKATDVLIDIEAKVNVLLDLVRAQDLVIKVLSNKLNDVMGRLDKQQAAPPRIVVETVQGPSKTGDWPAGFTQIPAGDPDRVIPFVAETALPQTDTPQGFRRNSRPETYASKSVPMPAPPAQQKLGDDPVERKMPIQLPPGMSQKQQQMAGLAPPPGRSTVPEVSTVPGLKKGSKDAIIVPPNPQDAPVSDVTNPVVAPTGQIPVIQRCVDKNSKAIFLADVEIVDMATMQTIFKTRTNGAGKWQAPLAVGDYRVTIRKRENVTKEKIEAVQDIHVDGSVSKMELPLLIIK
jgi:hypothetical protein